MEIIEKKDPNIGLRINGIEIISYIGLSRWNRKVYEYKFKCGLIRKNSLGAIKNIKYVNHPKNCTICKEKYNQLNTNPNIGLKINDIEIISSVGDGYYEYKCICGRIGRTNLRNLKSKLHKRICSPRSCGDLYELKNRQLLNGTRIGDLLILEYISGHSTHAKYKYKCICGRDGIKGLREINKKNTCKALSCHDFYYRRFLGLTVHTRTILKLDETVKFRRYYIVQCECGRIDSIRCDQMINETKRGKTCIDCSQKKYKFINSSTNNSPEYQCWKALFKRCYNKKDRNYHNYGGRGIKVCERWYSSFENFYNDMGPKPYPDYQIDRIDVGGDYEPSNCKWVSRSENVRNRRVSAKNQWRYPLIDITKLCKSCINCKNCGELFGKKKEKLIKIKPENQLTLV